MIWTLSCFRAVVVIVLSVASAAIAASGSATDAPYIVPQFSRAAPIQDRSFSRTGRLATADGQGHVDIWDVSSRVLMRTLAIPEVSEDPTASKIALSPDGRTLAYANAKGSVQLWDVATGRLGKTLQEPVGRPERVVWSPDGKLVAAGGSTVRLWNAAAGGVFRAFAASGDIAFSSDGKLLATVGDGKAQLFDAATGKLIRTFSDDSGLMPPIAISPDKALLATGGEDPDWHQNIVAALESESAHELKVKIWNAHTGKLVRMLPGDWYGTSVLRFGQDNRTLFRAGSGCSSFWDVKTGKMKQGFLGSGDVSSDGKLVASGYDSLVVRSSRTGKVVYQAPLRPARIRAIAFSPDGLLLAAGSEGVSGSGVSLWDISKGSLHRAFQNPPSGIQNVGFLPGGRVMSNGYNGSFIWNVVTGKLVAKHTGPMEAPGETSPFDRPSQQWATLSPDGSIMVNESGGYGRHSFELRDAATGKVLRTISLRSGTVFESAFSPDGRYLVARVSMSPDQMQVFDLTSGKTVSTLQDTRSARTLAFSPDGRTIAGSVDSGIALWDRDSGGTLLRIPAAEGLTFTHPDPCGWEKGRAASIAFAPDGKAVAVGYVQEVRIYDVMTGSETARLRAGDEVFQCVAFSPDGARIAAGNDAGQVCLWDVKSRRLVISMVALPTSQKGKPATEWLAWTPDGHYDWSPGAEKMLRWNKNGKMLPASSLASQLRRRNLLKPQSL